MVKLNKIVIGSGERGILFKDKQFSRVLTPGTYRLWSVLTQFTVEVYDAVKTPELKGSSVKILLQSFVASGLNEYVEKVATTSREVAVVYLNAQAYEILLPGEERLFWRGLNEITVKRYDISENYELSRESVRDLALIVDERKILKCKVPEQFKGILMDAGVIVRELEPGMYAFWRAQRDLSVAVLDTRLSALEVSGQEMLTKDKVSLRVNLAVSYRLNDVAKAMRALSDIQGEIYRTAQLSLRQAIGEKTLDELLESKEALNRALANELATSMGSYGIEVSRVGVKDIILPGDMRTLLNQVVEAEKAAQAQNIRRREEVAATRSLLNTAKMMENNPVMLRLKELEAVERISDKVEKLTVYDGLNGMMKSMVSLKE